ncbi:hypothetical protein [Dickeya undicola]|nr:hypothetical protein [Dickeya undicola]
MARLNLERQETFTTVIRNSIEAIREMVLAGMRYRAEAVGGF